MNRYIFLVLIILIAPRLFSMKEKVARKLFVENTTEWPINIKYITTDGLLERVVRHGEIVVLDDASSITSLILYPYGKWLGKLSKESLTGGLLKPSDKTSKFTPLLKHDDAKLNISLPKGLNRNFSGFKVTGNYPTEEDRALPQSLEEAFAYLKQLVLSEKSLPKTIEAHHFLSLPEGASENSLLAAYKAKKDPWEKAKDSDLKKQVLMYIEKSYTILQAEIDLKKKKDELSNLIFTHFSEAKK